MKTTMTMYTLLIATLAVAPSRAQEAPEINVEPPTAAPQLEEETVPPAAEHQAPAPSPEQLVQTLDQALAELRHEPDLAALQRAALRFADADVDRAASWSKAPNRAALLPVLRLVFDHDMKRNEQLDRYQVKPDRWAADTDRDLGFQVSAQWYLNELIFNPDEVRVYGALADRAARRESLLTALTGYYFERRRLQLVARLAPPTDLLALTELRLKIEELTATIDALTGGLLTRNLEKNRAKPR